MPSITMAFPPGLRTLTISSYAFSGSARFHRRSRDTTRSNEQSSKLMSWASILMNSAFRPCSCALATAFLTISSE